MEDIQQGNDGRWYRKIGPGEFEETDAPAASPGRAGKEQVARGAVGFFGSTMDAGKSLARTVFASSPVLSRQAGVGVAPEPQPNEGQSYRDRFADATGIGPPDSFSGQVGEFVGGSLPLTVLTSGLSSAGGGFSGFSAALKDNLIRDVAASTASVYAGKKGYGRTGQMVAGVLAAIAVPTKIPGFVSNALGFGGDAAGAASGVAAQADDAAQAMAGPAQAAATVPTKMLSDSEVMKLAKQYDVNPDNIREVAKMAQDRIMIDPRTGKPMVEEFVAQIDDAMRIFPNPKVRPPTAAMVGKYGGGNFAALENEVTLVDAVENSRAAGIRDAVAKDLGERWDNLVGGGSVEGALDKSSGLKEVLRSVKSRAWDEVPFDELPVRPANSLTSTLAKMKNGRVMLYKAVDSHTKDLIESLDESVTARDLQDMRARLGEVIADPEASNFARESSNILKRVIDSELDQLPEEGSKAYRAAVASTAKFYDTFPGDSAIVKALETTTDRTRIANAILKSKKPADEFAIAQKIFGQAEGGASDLKAVLMQRLVGENIGDVPMSTVKKELSNAGISGVYKELLGPEDFATFKDVLKGYEMGITGTSGTPAQIAKVQSSAVARLTAGISSPLKRLKNVPNEVSQAIDSLNEEERRFMLNEMIFDGELTRKLAVIPLGNAPQKEVTSWLANFSKMAARSAVRTQVAAANGGAQASSRLPAAMRAAIAPMAVNQPLPDQGQGGVR